MMDFGRNRARDKEILNKQMAAARTLPYLLMLPNEILLLILSYFSYERISMLRIVCRKFDEVCKTKLNHGLADVKRRQVSMQRQVHAKLPRRESKRRNHDLARHMEILTALDTRLSLLSITYNKYNDINLCCFIPGKVLDEVLYVLKVLSSSKNPPRAYELLRELRDLSSMAIEHFDEKIAPTLKQSLPGTSYSSLASSSPLGDKAVRTISNRCAFNREDNAPEPSLQNLVNGIKSMRKEIAVLKAQTLNQSFCIHQLKLKCLSYESKFAELGVSLDQSTDANRLKTEYPNCLHLSDPLCKDNCISSDFLCAANDAHEVISNGHASMNQIFSEWQKAHLQFLKNDDAENLQACVKRTLSYDTAGPSKRVCQLDGQ